MAISGQRSWISSWRCCIIWDSEKGKESLGSWLSIGECQGETALFMGIKVIDCHFPKSLVYLNIRPYNHHKFPQAS